MNANLKRPLIGLVLAGGKSTRMGVEKAALVHPDGRTQARRTHDLLKEAGCDEVIFSLRHDQELLKGFEGMPHPSVTRDLCGESDGPLSGLLASMRTRCDADWLVLACDLPRLDLTTLTHLNSSKQSGEPFLSYRSEFDGLPEPLCTLYGEGSLEMLEEAATRDIRCPRKILIRKGCRLLDAVSPRALHNANTPEDWALATSP